MLNPNGGNIGIGTASPGQKLSVAGTIESTTGGIKFPDGQTQTVAVRQLGTLLSNSVDQAVSYNAWATLTWDTEEEDYGNFHSAVNPTRITVPAGAGGLYLVCHHVFWADNVNGARVTMLRLNGSQNVLRMSSTQQAITGWYTMNSSCGRLRLNEGDYLEVRVCQLSGGSLNVNKDGTGFSLTFLPGQ